MFLSRSAICFALICLGFAAGCKSAPEIVAAPPAVSSTVIAGSFEDVWQITRQTLLDQKYEIYTRDTRGLFVAYTKVKRHLLFFPRRTQFTITLESVSPDATRVGVETIQQRYRVTLLTYPDWRDHREPAEVAAAEAILNAIERAVEQGGGVESEGT